MKIIVSGSSGLIGTALVRALKAKDYTVLSLVRRKPINDSEIFWEPLNGKIDTNKPNDSNCVINLSGENIASGKWTEDKKKKILESRIKTTNLLCNTLLNLDKPPSTLISASAVGYYGNCWDNETTENSPHGCGFVADVCRQWESTTQICKEAGIRVVNCRFGVVLSESGGALKKMLPAFKIGLGGRIGTGQQYMSWISIDDCIRALLYLIENKNIKNAVNITAPEPVTNSEFTKALAKSLKRPSISPVPEFLIKTLFGEMGKELLLEGCKVIPEKLLKSGFKFKHSDIDSALKEILNS